MNTRTHRRTPLLLLALIVGACSGKGPDVIDPSSTTRTQTAFLAVDTDTGGELAIVREPDALGSTTGYADANGAPLGRHIDGIYESFDRLFLLQSSGGAITIVDMGTRQKRAEITGFGDSAVALCGLAFSNLSQAWAIDHNRPFVYHIDSYNAVLVDTLPIDGRPTAVAAADDKVFVGSLLADGSGQVSIFASNFGTYRIDKTLRFPSPPVFLGANGNEDAMIAVTAGVSGGRPTVHSISLATLEQTAERALTAPAMTERIGTVPEFATITRDNYLYVATEEVVYRIDVKSARLSSSPAKWLEGEYDVIGADYWTDLFYAYNEATGALDRIDRDGNDLSPISVGRPVSAIEFVNTSRVQ